MRSGAWLLRLTLAAALAAPFSGCSGGYSLPPTRCDEYCDATESFACDTDYDPSGCVATCRNVDPKIYGPTNDNGPFGTACPAEFDAMIACYRAAPRTKVGDCEYLAEFSCAQASNEFATCLNYTP